MGKVFRTGASSAARTAERNAKELREYARGLEQSTKFQPIGVTTGFGNFGYNEDTGYSASLSPEQQAMQAQLFEGAQGLFSQATVDPSQRAAEITQQQIALLQPELQKQQAALGQNLFGSGRLGLQLSGGAVGAGGGMVQPDVFGFNQALGQTLAGITANARSQALGEQGQLAQIGQGLFGAGQQLSDRELQLLQFGIDAESARQSGNIASGQLGLGGMQAGSQMQNDALQKKAGQRAGLLSGVVQAAASTVGGGR